MRALALLFALATLVARALFFRQDLSGILTGSGLVLAVRGFAIRNVVAGDAAPATTLRMSATRSGSGRSRPQLTPVM